MLYSPFTGSRTRGRDAEDAKEMRSVKRDAESQITNASTRLPTHDAVLPLAGEQRPAPEAEAAS